MGIPVIDTGLVDMIAFPELGTALPLAEIYRDIDFAPGAPAAP
jgi:hypothetical protein